ncbi:uncharacterized protein L203_104606 [Cryptococcus depauperatus CBS 7841]|uniref:Uncharacterized protein n=1 Tax=Cryptococcus depauperatus CBS 7841 TaxID=1295531 RepID=A0A1E3ILK6_9TREE|nr:hypothetical protein L203_02190 [Cryptococcus depauperatus CBS 7841]
MICRQTWRALGSLQQAAKHASSKPLCPTCSATATLQRRHYSSVPSTRSRGRPLASEFSVGPSRPKSQNNHKPPKKLDTTDSLLRAQFQTVFHSHATAPNPKQALNVAFPLVFRRAVRPLLEPHLLTISMLVAPLLEDESSSDDERRQVLILLGHCYGRIASSPHLDPLRVQHISEIYSKALVLEAMHGKGDKDKWKSLLVMFESVLDRLVKEGPTPILSPEIVTVWVILRVKTGAVDTVKSSYIWPQFQEVKNYLSRTLVSYGETQERYMDAAEALMKQSVEVMSSLPKTIEILDRELASMRNRGDWDSITNLWGRIRAGILYSPDQAEGILEPSPEVRYHVLSSFLLTFKRPKSNWARLHVSPPPPSYALRAKEVLSLCPVPLPRTIAYALLALRVRPEDNVGLRAGHDAFSLDTDERLSGEGDVLSNLKMTWRDTEAKDLKMYMIYIEGLGRLGDLDGLKEVWNELVTDERCKELYMREEGLPTSAPFPPIHALNHMISACLLIPADGPPLAFDLFAQVTRSDSAVSCNIITINTILRHHAREANIEAMSQLFEQATHFKLQPDVVTYTTLVQGLLRARRLDLAKNALDAMHAQGIIPNERMCSMLIADLAKLGTRVGLSHAEELLKLMHQKNMRSNEVTWTALISGYFRGGWESDAWEALARMERLGIRLNRIGYNMLLKQVSGTEEGLRTVMSLWRRLLKEGINPNSDTYWLVLSPLVKERKMEQIDEVLAEMKSRGYRAEKGALARLLDNIRRWG